MLQSKTMMNWAALAAFGSLMGGHGLSQLSPDLEVGQALIGQAGDVLMAGGTGAAVVVLVAAVALRKALGVMAIAAGTLILGQVLGVV